MVPIHLCFCISKAFYNLPSRTGKANLCASYKYNIGKEWIVITSKTTDFVFPFDVFLILLRACLLACSFACLLVCLL